MLNRDKINAYNRKYRKEAFKLFGKFKTEQGCAVCGYNKCGASLDFHHVESRLKKFRILARHYMYMTEKTIEEMNKCMLLCKNCHYEIEKCGDVK